MPPRLAARLLALAPLLALTGCAGSGGSPPASSTSAAVSAPAEPLDVVAAFYPLQFVAERVGGDAARVENLTQPGAEPHDLELTPRQAAALAEADVVVYLRGLQPAVDRAVDASARDRALDVAAVTPLAPAEGGGEDPHVWLDPTRVQTLADALARRLQAAAPAAARALEQRRAVLSGELAALDADFRRGLATCERRDLVTSHESFGYLARTYGLRQVGISGLLPEEEPSPRRVAQVTEFAREHDVRTIFFEETVSPRTAEVLAREVGAQARVLSPLETAPEQGDYLTAMRADLAALRQALGCR